MPLFTTRRYKIDDDENDMDVSYQLKTTENYLMYVMTLFNTKVPSP